LIVSIARPESFQTVPVLLALLVNTFQMVVKVARRVGTVEHSLGKRFAQLVWPGDIVRVLVKQLIIIFVLLVVTERPADKHLPPATDCVHWVNIVSLVHNKARTAPPAQWQPRPAVFRK
jgi:hypothetical protein